MPSGVGLCVGGRLAKSVPSTDLDGYDLHKRFEFMQAGFPNRLTMAHSAHRADPIDQFSSSGGSSSSAPSMAAC